MFINSFKKRLLPVAILFVFLCSTESIKSQCTACIPGSVGNSNGSPWSDECYRDNNCNLQGNPCQSNDVTLLKIFLSDASGIGLPVCSPGTPTIAQLSASFNNNTGSSRYAVRIYAEVHINGVCAYEINTCGFDLLVSGQTDTAFLSFLTYNCGDVLSLRNLWIAWATTASQCSNPMGANYASTCGDYPPSKCFKNLAITKLLSPNFTYDCGVLGANTPLCFFDLTVGGTLPYTWKWYFGDGDSSSLQNPCHTYIGRTGIDTVRLKVTDSTGLVTTAYQIINLAFLDCCTIPRDATVTPFSSRGCYNLDFNPSCGTGTYDFDLTELYTPNTTRGQGSVWSIISGPGCGIIGETFVARPGCHQLRYFVPSFGKCIAKSDTAILQITEEPQPDFELANDVCWNGVAGSVTVPTLYNGSTFGTGGTVSYAWTAAIISGGGPVPTFSSTTVQSPTVTVQGAGTFRICVDETISYPACFGNQIVPCTRQHCELFVVHPTTVEAVPTWGPVPGPFCVSQVTCVDLDALVSVGSTTGGVFTGAGVQLDPTHPNYRFCPNIAGVGTHVICYTVNNGAGCSATACHNITVYPTVTLNCTDTRDTLQCATKPLGPNNNTYGPYNNVTLSSRYTLGTHYLNSLLCPSANPNGAWSFISGPTATSGSVSVGILYFTDPGCYTVRYTVSSFPGATGMCTATQDFTVHVGELPMPMFDLPEYACWNQIANSITFDIPNNFLTSPTYTGTVVRSFTSSVPAVATVTSPGGIVTVVGNGNTTICMTETVTTIACAGVTTTCQATTCEKLIVTNSTTAVNPAWTALGPLCIDQGCQDLDALVVSAGGTTGGIFTGAGVQLDPSHPNYCFNPATAGVGIHAITYTVHTPDGCIGVLTRNVQVMAATDASLVADRVEGCFYFDGNSGPFHDYNLSGLYTPTNTRGGTWSYISGPGQFVSGEILRGAPGCHQLRYTVPARFPGAVGACGQKTDDIFIVFLELPVPDFDMAEEVCWNGAPGSVSLSTLYNGKTFGNNATRTFSWTASLVSGAGPVPTFITPTSMNPTVVVQGAGTFNICMVETLTYGACGTVGAGAFCFSTHCERLTVHQTNLDAIPSWTPPGPFCVDQACVDLDALVSMGSTQGGVFTGAGVQLDPSHPNYRFCPTVAGPGTHSVCYTVNNGAGCTAVECHNIVVYPAVTLACVDTRDTLQCVTKPKGPNNNMYGPFNGITLSSRYTLGTHSLNTLLCSTATRGGSWSLVSGPGAGKAAVSDALLYYTDPGCYTVRYTVSSFPGAMGTCTATQDFTIHVGEMPMPMFDLPDEVCWDQVSLVTYNIPTTYLTSPTYTGSVIRSYRSTNPAVATVSPAGGLVTIVGNGTTQICMQDSVITIACSGVTTNCRAEVCEVITVHNNTTVVNPAWSATGPYCVTLNTCIDLDNLVTGTQNGIFTGHGVTIDGAHPEYCFNPSLAGVGTHAVTYTVNSPDGCTAVLTRNIVVVAQCISDLNLAFNNGSFGCYNSDQFRASSFGPRNEFDLSRFYLPTTTRGGIWSFVSNPPNTPGPNAIANETLFGGPGCYTLRYTVSCDPCSQVFSDITFSIVERPTPVFDIAEEACWDGVAGTLVIPTDYQGTTWGTNGTRTYNWTVTQLIGPGPVPTLSSGVGVFQAINEPTVTINGAGYFEICVTERIQYPLCQGQAVAECTNTYCERLTIHQSNVEAIPTWTPAGPFCVDEPCIDLDARVTGDPNGVFTGVGVQLDPSHPNYRFCPMVAGPGTHTVCYTVNNGAGCTAVECHNIVVYPAVVLNCADTRDTLQCATKPKGASTNNYGPFGGVTLTSRYTLGTHSLNALLCANATRGGTWSFINGPSANTGAVADALLYYTSPGCYTVRYTVRSFPGANPAGACFATQDFTIHVGEMPMPMFDLPDNVCWDQVTLVTYNIPTMFLTSPTYTGAVVRSYTSTNPTVATVSPAGGLVTIVGNGITTICMEETVTTIACSGVTTTCIAQFCQVLRVQNNLTVVNPAWNDPGPICIDEACRDLDVLVGAAGGTPNGIFTGRGVRTDPTHPNYCFDPGVAGVGTHAVTYTVNSPDGCTSVLTRNIVVYPRTNARLVADRGEGCFEFDGNSGPFHDFDLSVYYTDTTTRGGTWTYLSGPGQSIRGEILRGAPGCHQLRYTIPASFPGATGACGSKSDTIFVLFLEIPQPDFDMAEEVCWDGLDGSLTIPTWYNGRTFGNNATRTFAWTASILSGAGPVPTFNTPTSQSPTLTIHGAGVFNICVTERLDYPTCGASGAGACLWTHCEILTVHQTNVEAVPTWTPAGPYCVDEPCVDLDARVTGNIGGVFTGVGVQLDPSHPNYRFCPTVAGPGTHTVCYTVNNGAGCTAVECHNIVVYPAVVLNCADTRDTLQCSTKALGTTNNNYGPFGGVTLTSRYTLESYSLGALLCANATRGGNWSFISGPTGGTFGTVADGILYYTNPGCYTVRYTVSSFPGANPAGACTKFQDFTIHIGELPMPMFDLPDNVCWDQVTTVTYNIPVNFLTSPTYLGSIARIYRSTNTTVATVNASGLVTIVGNGITTICMEERLNTTACGLTTTCIAEVCQVIRVQNNTSVVNPAWNILGPLCIDQPCQDLDILVAAAGGTPNGIFTGRGVRTDPTHPNYCFDPAVAGAGTHAITYTVNSPDGCTSVLTRNVVVFPANNATLMADLGIGCIDLDLFNPFFLDLSQYYTSATTRGGTWTYISGPGNGSGNPIIRNETARLRDGCHQLRYTVGPAFPGAVGVCGTMSDDIFISIGQEPDPDFDMAEEACWNGINGSLVLPTYYNGNTFAPSNGTLTYLWTANVISGGPAPTFSSTTVQQPSLIIHGAGVFSICIRERITDIACGTFPAGAFCEETHCEILTIHQTNVEVDPSWDPFGPICIDEPCVDLTGRVRGNPGGVFTGVGVENNGHPSYLFCPDQAGPGTHTVCYTVNNGAGCTAVECHNITVVPTVQVNCEINTVVLQCATKPKGNSFNTFGPINGEILSSRYTLGTFSLNSALCASATRGGTWDLIRAPRGGTGVILDNLLYFTDPGCYEVVYTVTSFPNGIPEGYEGGCAASQTFFIHIGEMPMPMFDLPDNVCWDQFNMVTYDIPGAFLTSPNYTGIVSRTYSSSNPSVATVNSAGLVTVVGNGITTICMEETITTIACNQTTSTCTAQFCEVLRVTNSVTAVNPTWGPLGPLCIDQPCQDLDALVTGTSGGVFTGQGVMADGRKAYLFGVNSQNNLLYRFDTATWTQSTIVMTLAGFPNINATSISYNPANGLYYAIIDVTPGGTDRRLVRVDTTTGVCTMIGNLGDRFSSMTFSPAGKLYAVTGNNGIVQQGLYEINPANASKTLLRILTIRLPGNVIAFNKDNGLIYRWAGSDFVLGPKLFQSISTTPPYTSTDIVEAGVPRGEISGAVYMGNNRFLITNNNNVVFRETTSGAYTVVNPNIGFPIRGLAFGNGSVGHPNYLFCPAIAGVGTHAVTYTVNSPDGCTAVFTRNVIVAPAANATLVSDSVVCQVEPAGILDLTGLFTAMTTGGGVFTKTSGPASGRVIGGNQFNYREAGCYCFSYTVSTFPGATGACTATGTACLLITEQPTPSFDIQNERCWNITDPVALKRDTLKVNSPTYDPASTLTRTLRVMSGPATVIANGPTIFAVEYTGAGNVMLCFEEKLTAAACGTAIPAGRVCIDTFCRQVSVMDGTSLNANFTVTGAKTEYCPGDTITFTPITPGGIFTGTNVGNSNPPGTTGGVRFTGCGTYVVTYTVETPGGCVNASSQTFFTDRTDPVFTGPNTAARFDTVVNCDGLDQTARMNAWAGRFGFTDNCQSRTSFRVYDRRSGCSEMTGTYIFEVTSLDTCDNVTRVYPSYKVQDTTRPTITRQASDLVLQCGDLTVINILNWLNTHGGALATDACSAPDDLKWTYDFSGIVADYCSGAESFVTFTVTDDCHNSNTTRARITINNRSSIVWIIDPVNITLECNTLYGRDPYEEVTSWLARVGDGVALDSCQTYVRFGNNFNQIPWTPGCNRNTGSKLVTFAAYDVCGNSSTRQATVKIVDLTPPQITSPAKDSVVECDGLGNVTAFNTWIANHGGARAVDYCSGELLPICAPLPSSRAAFMTGANLPWGGGPLYDDYTTSMNTVFGAGNWDRLFFSTVNAATLFSPAYRFIYIDGSDGSANEFNSFVNTNRALMESWVACGGRLLLNAAPNQGGNILLGFGGVSILYPAFTGSVTQANPHAIFNGPFLPTGTNYTGTFFGHALICPPGMTAIIKEPAGLMRPVLMESLWGNGLVMFGGMTASGWHAPQPNARNLKWNILTYLNVRALPNDLKMLADGIRRWDTVRMRTELGCGQNRTLTYMFRAVDTCFNVSNATIAKFIVRDTLPPVWQTNPSNLVVDCDAKGNVAQLNAWLAANGNGVVTTDLCNGTVLIEHDLVRDYDKCSNTDSVVYRFTAYDCSRNSSTREASFVIRDITPPTIVSPARDTLISCENLSGNNDDEFIGWLNNRAGFVASDMCSDVINYSNNYVAANWVKLCSNTKFVIVTFRATDDCGNVTTSTARFSISDVIRPVFLNCPPPIVQNAEADHCDAYVTVPKLIATDNCTQSDSIVITRIFGPDPTQFRFPVGTTILKYRAVDLCGNADTCTIKVVVNDYWDVPSITCPANLDLENDPGVCGNNNVTGIAPTSVKDLCPHTAVTYVIRNQAGDTIKKGINDASGSDFPKGINQVCYTVQDQPILLITEVTQQIGGAVVGPTNPLPSFIAPTDVNGDYIEITNFGPSSIDVSCLSLKIFQGGVQVGVYTLPNMPGPVLPAGGVLTLHVGPAVAGFPDNPGLFFFNMNLPEAVITMPRGYVLSHLDLRNLDVVTTNGYNITAPAQGVPVVTAADWSGISLTNVDRGSYYRRCIFDYNNATDWLLAEGCEPATIGRVNPVLVPFVFPSNGLRTSVQTIAAQKDTCCFNVSVRDTELPMCATNDTFTFNGTTGTQSGPGCYTFNIVVPATPPTKIVDVWLTNLNLTATNFANTEGTLIHPDGTRIRLWNDGTCTGFTNFVAGRISDLDLTKIANAVCANLNAGLNYMPQQPLAALCPKSAAGTWRLEIENNSPPTSSITLSSWSLRIISQRGYAQRDTMINNDLNLCGASFMWTHPTVMDNCCMGTVDVQYIAVPMPGCPLHVVPKGGRVNPGTKTTQFFGVGMTRIVYTLVDMSGNIGTCEFKLTVKDAQAPVFTACPGDYTINLDEGDCATPLEVNTGLAYRDNCDSIAIVYNPPLGTLLRIGVHKIVVTITDKAGNTAMCMWFLTVRENNPAGTDLSCHDQLNFSLGPDCTGTITADELLAGLDYGCKERYLLDVEDLANGLKHSTTFTVQDIGKCFKITVTDPVSGNKCWSKVCIEYKATPTIDCPRDTIVACNSSLDPEFLGNPRITSCVLNYDIHYDDTITKAKDCDFPIAFIIKRTFTVTNELGNGAKCTQTIQVKAFDLSKIEWPRSYDNLDLPALHCDAKRYDKDVSPHIIPAPYCVDGYLLDSAYWYATGGDPRIVDPFTRDLSGDRLPKLLGWNYIVGGINDGHPSPYGIYYPEHPQWRNSRACWGPNQVWMWQGTGAPSLDGVALNKDNKNCNLSIRYDDEVYDVCANGYEILRYWKVRNMCLPPLAGVNPVEYIQVIKVLDEEGPKIAYPDTVIVGTGPWTCTGTWEVPFPWITDNCSDSITYSVRTWTGTAIQQLDGSWIVINMKLGVYPVVITAQDACGNKTEKVIKVNVIDNTPPTAVCDQNIVVSIAGNQSPGENFGKIFAEDINEGSFDNCKAHIFFKAIRMDQLRGTNNGSNANQADNGTNCTAANGDDNAVLDGNQIYFDDHVKFCCSDAGKRIMVVLRVFDIEPGDGPISPARMNNNGNLFGHYSDCMVEIEVQDKGVPTVIAPPNVVVSCWFWFDIDKLDDPNDATFGRVVTDLTNRHKVVTTDLVCYNYCVRNDITGYPGFVPGAPPSNPPAWNRACDYYRTLFDTAHYDRKYELVWGFDGYVLSNCGNNPTISVNDNRECGQGQITRTVVARGPNGISVTATQTIWVVDCDPFYINRADNCDSDDDITWPGNCTGQATTIDGCGADISPDNPLLGRPVIENGADDLCALISIEYFDEIFTIEPDACFKVLRKWVVIDWCQYDPSLDPTRGRWEYLQIIKVHDTDKPVVSINVGACEPAVKNTTDNICYGHLALSADATDNCSPLDWLFYDYKIDLYNDGNGVHQGYDVKVGPLSRKQFAAGDRPLFHHNPYADDENNPFDASGSYPVGIHKICWFVEDGCGNVGTLCQLIEIKDCKAPTPYCLTGVITVPMPSSKCVTVWAKDLDRGSFDNCTRADALSFYFDGDPAKPSITICCDDFVAAGANDELVVNVQMWVEDEEGNTDYCRTTIVVQDNQDICPNTTNTTGRITGNLKTEKGDATEFVNVQMYLGPTMMKQVNTHNDGQFMFGDLVVGAGMDYVLRPNRNDNHVNGVTTADIVKIQRHILGLEQLNSPYKLIAADVNASNNITAADVAEIRKLILGINAEFTKVPSWTFVPSSYVFPLPIAPWNAPRDIMVSMPNPGSHTEDFVSIKMGDVNTSAQAHDFRPSSTRHNDQLHFEIENGLLKAGEVYEVRFMASNFVDISGYQYTLKFDQDAMIYEGLASGALDVDESNFGLKSIDQGSITTSWNSLKKAVSFTPEEVLFTLRFRALKDAPISELIAITSDLTVAEAYNLNLDVKGVDLGVRTDNGVVESSIFELYQNTPNPFDNETVINFRLPTASAALLTIYDAAGKVVRVYDINGIKGLNSIKIGKDDLIASGILYYQLDAANHTATKRMTKMK